MKRKIERPCGRKRSGGWVIQRGALLELLKKGDAVELSGITVGTQQLRKLINLLPYEDCLIRSNGRLEIETVQRVFVRRNGARTTSFQKPRHYHQFLGILHRAWLPRVVNTVVVVKPRKY